MTSYLRVFAAVALDKIAQKRKTSELNNVMVELKVKLAVLII